MQMRVATRVTGLAGEDEIGLDGATAAFNGDEVVNIVVHLRIGLHVLWKLAEHALVLVSGADFTRDGVPASPVGVPLYSCDARTGARKPGLESHR